MSKLSGLCVILGISFTRAYAFERVRLADEAPVTQTMAECAFTDMVESLGRFRAMGVVPGVENLQTVDFLARTECVKIRRLDVKERLDDATVDRTMRAALGRALSYVYRSVDI